jgi:broad specificity phosphatase PhoE
VGLNLILVRHGRTAWNRDVRFRGRMDLPLDDFGLAQARAVAQAVRERWPRAAAVYASPLLRAQQTAQPIAAELDLVVQQEPGLLDIDYGSWTGKTPAEAETEDPDRYLLWHSHPQQVRFPGGESLSQVQDRLVAMLELQAKAHAGREIVLVGHLVVNRVLLCTVLGLGLEGYWRLGQDNAAINLLEYKDGRGILRCLNDTCHLRQGQLQGGSNV